jgi:autotransporter-associated beta strand protein
VTIDTNTQNVTVPQALNAPTGTGVTSASLSAAGSGYIAAPIVQFSGGTVSAGGTGATGVAVIDPITGQVTGITITNPGNYDDTSTLTATLIGGGGTGATIDPTFLTGANVGGGLNKVGAGTLTLSGANTLTGASTVSGGTLVLASTGSLNNAASLAVSDGSTLQLDHSLSLNNSISLTLVTGTTLNLNFSSGFEEIGMLVLNGISAPAGTYDAAALATLDGATGITFTGTGSLTVVPEPSVIALLAAGLGTWLIVLRRRRPTERV